MENASRSASGRALRRASRHLGRRRHRDPRTRPLWRSDRTIRLVPTRANGQPAFVYYLGDANAGVVRAAGLFVLTLGPERIIEITRFGDCGVLPWFGLSRTLPG